MQRRKVRVGILEEQKALISKTVVRIPLLASGLPASATNEDLPLAVQAGQRVEFVNATGEDIRVEFLDDDGAVIITPVNQPRIPALEKGEMRATDVVPAGETRFARHEVLVALAGPDGILPIEGVRIVPPPAGASQPTYESLGTAYLRAEQAETLRAGRIVIPLEVTGIGDWRFLNPRSAQIIGPETTLVFVPRVPGRTFTVTFQPITRDLKNAFELAGFVVRCDRPRTCVPSLEVQTTQREVSGQRLIEAYAAEEGIVEFRVAFFEADIEPANASGFVRVRDTPFEPPSATTFNLTGWAAVQRDPYFEGFPQDAAKNPVIGGDHPFTDQHRTHFAGNVRLLARHQMGNRASGEVELLVKDKDFGVAESPTVTTQKARVNVFGLNGFILSLGRFEFAAPTRALAINETGEGIAGRWRWFSTSYIVRPRDPYDLNTDTPPAGFVGAQPSAGDRWSLLNQVQGSYGVLRWEGSALYGRRKTFAGGAGPYYTVGGDLLAAGGLPKLTSETKEPGAIWRLSAGGYSSRREARASDVDAPDDDKGWTLLADASVAKLSARRPRLTIGGTFARSSADDPATSADESYVGESASFAPDRLFLATFASRLSPLALTELDAGGQPRLIRRGISGKSYYGAGVIVHGFSPLLWLVRLAQVPTGDVGLTSTTVRFHRYTLRNPIPDQESSARPDKGLGKEGTVEFLTESPRGVRYGITASGFWPESVLKTQNLITKRVWSLDARVTITMR